MVNLEIELRGDLPPDEIFKFRDFLHENLPDAGITIKHSDPLPGQMAGELIEPCLQILLHAGLGIALEKLYLNLLDPLLGEYMHKLKSSIGIGGKLEIMSSLSQGDDKVSILQRENGTQLFNYKYEIDPDKTLLVLVGSSEFGPDFPPIPPVKGNIEDLYKIFIDKTHVGIPRENVILSLNDEHTVVQKKLLEASHRQSINTLIFYFAGHGHRVDADKLTLVTKDSEKIDSDIIGGIELEFVNNILKRSTARQKLLILDTCHSGIATQGDDNPAPGVEVKGNLVIASSPAEDVSYFEKSLRNTYFTGALLEAMDKGIDNTNDMLAIGDIFDFTRQVFSVKKFPRPQMREDLSIPASSFYIARNPGFSIDKLTWRAVNMMKDGNLESAMNELRTLVKHYPDDLSIKKHFEECEAELSFSKILNQANDLFYNRKDYAAALPLYKQADAIKDDPMVRERIRECELPKTNGQPPGTMGSITEVENQAEYISFRKAVDRKAWYTGYGYLKNLLYRFPSNNFLSEEMQRLEKKLTSLSGTRDDERLGEFYKVLDKGHRERAAGILKTIISNDPEDPALLNIEKTLDLQIKEDQQQKKEEGGGEEKPTLFRMFKLLSPLLQGLILIVLGLIIYYFFYLIHSDYVKENENKKRTPSNKVSPEYRNLCPFKIASIYVLRIILAIEYRLYHPTVQ